MDKLDQNLYAESMKKALRVDFISNSEELRLYATSIYNASIWSRGVDKRNKAILKRNRFFKIEKGKPTLARPNSRFSLLHDYDANILFTF